VPLLSKVFIKHIISIIIVNGMQSRLRGIHRFSEALEKRRAE
jgi:hypothetical protein